MLMEIYLFFDLISLQTTTTPKAILIASKFRDDDFLELKLIKRKKPIWNSCQMVIIFTTNMEIKLREKVIFILTINSRSFLICFGECVKYVSRFCSFLSSGSSGSGFLLFGFNFFLFFLMKPILLSLSEITSVSLFAFDKILIFKGSSSLRSFYLISSILRSFFLSAVFKILQ